MNRTGFRSRFATAFKHAVLMVVALMMLFPFIWMISLSLKPPGEIFRNAFWLLPEQFYAVENYWKALTTAPLSRFMLNGAIVCASILALQIAICAPVAYALANCDFAGEKPCLGWFW